MLKETEIFTDFKNDEFYLRVVRIYIPVLYHALLDYYKLHVK